MENLACVKAAASLETEFTITNTLRKSKQNAKVTTNLTAKKYSPKARQITEKIWSK